MIIQHYTNCTKECYKAIVAADCDPTTYCATPTPPGGTCYSCADWDPALCGTSGCHPTQCLNVSGILSCITANNPTGNAYYDDCVNLSCLGPPIQPNCYPYICGWCPGTGPNPTGTPLPTPVGATPTPLPTLAPGTIRARAMRVNKTDTSCTAVRSSVTGVTGTIHRFSPSSPSQPAPQTQSGTTYSVFNNLGGGNYTIASLAPAGYVFARACWSRSTAPTSGETLTALLYPSDTLTWDLGYTFGSAWSQTTGGDVYAATALRSFVPTLTVPRAFILDGTTGGYPGVATYGVGGVASFDSTGVTNGQEWVSRERWLVNDTGPDTNFYQLMYTQFGGTPATIDYVSPISPITKPDARAAPYYVTGNMTTSGAWTIGSGENLVFFVDGNLSIDGDITVTPGGFAAFIVNGSITINPAVSAVDGIFITSPGPAGTFDTGTGAVRFTGTGMFIAGTFTLGRDLGDALNPTTSSELFVYNPQFLMTMPEAMKKLSVAWQEVAP